MATLTYKCPNCDGGLIFDPKTQKFQCEYCASYFTTQDLENLTPDAAKTTTRQPENAEQTAAGGDALAVYSCPSCGAEIVTSETTAATICFYCHNPVVLSGRLDGNLTPNQVLPFVLKRDEAEKKFREWCGEKKFLQNGFTSSGQLEKLTGVYFPFWVVDSAGETSINADGTKVRIWRSGDTEYTETKIFRIERAGGFTLRDMPFAGIDREDVKLANGVFPFEFDKAIPFDMRYLMGFQAEKRALESAQCREAFESMARDSLENMLEETMIGFATVTGKQTTLDVHNENWRYTLLPVWAMTYHWHGKKYFFALNGQTGKVCGKLPLSIKKLALLFLGVSVGLFVVFALLIGGFFA